MRAKGMARAAGKHRRVPARLACIDLCLPVAVCVNLHGRCLLIQPHRFGSHRSVRLAVIPLDLAAGTGERYAASFASLERALNWSGQTSCTSSPPRRTGAKVGLAVPATEPGRVFWKEARFASS